MHRNTPRDTAGRAASMVSRATVNAVDDRKAMQELDADFLHSENRRKIERPQPYGFSSVPKARQQKQGQSVNQGGAEEKGPAAEAVMVFVGGMRSHPLAVMVDDRRHRAHSMKEGETAVYDDQHQAVHVSRDELRVESPLKVLLRHFKRPQQSSSS
ncbi:MAG: phage baseplate assembly protein, partial [Rhizobiales bacterium]|nr:phage baseplate assembly protein [Hyphomicrobiales bacterium]